MKKNKFVNSLGFKSWTYFVLFALSILLLLQFFQLILLEPFYIRTLKKEIKTFTNNVSDIFFSETEIKEKNYLLYSLTMNNNACVIVFDSTNSTTISGFDALGNAGCAIYNNSVVNERFIEVLENTDKDEIYLQGDFIELSDQEVIVYGKKFLVNDQEYYVISNITLQSINIITKTIQNQFILISLIVLTLSLLISLLFSKIISQPIIRIKEEANKLTYGNYELEFEDTGINEVQELADTIDLASKEISKVEEYRNELMANVSHDLKTPLTMIKAYAEMIKDISGDNKDKREKHLDIIINETDSLNTLVSDMLNLSKLQAGAISVDSEPFDLTEQLYSCYYRFEPLAALEDVTIEFECEPELIAIGDGNKIEEVLNNFVNNALKHYGEDRKIIIKGYLKNKDYIRVEVTDHGTGIDEESLPYIWDRYYKIDKHYQRSRSGSGLGLAICRAILETYNCKYGVISKINEGSTFYFEIPTIDLDKVETL